MIDEWLNPAHLRTHSALRKRFLTARPYPHLVLRDFFRKDVAEKVYRACLRQKFTRQISDLYAFSQMPDLKKTADPTLRALHRFWRSKEFLAFMSQVTGERLRSIDMSGFVYADTDHLLPHDDRLEGRKVAYIIGLSKGFRTSDGGALSLFDADRDGHPRRIAKSYPPGFNTLSFFKVSRISWHQVDEVLADKPRLSLTGWFHG